MFGIFYCSSLLISKEEFFLKKILILLLIGCLSSILTACDNQQTDLLLEGQTELEVVIETMQEEIDSLNDDLSIAKTEIKALEDELATANTNITSLEGELAKVNTHIAALEAELLDVLTNEPTSNPETIGGLDMDYLLVNANSELGFNFPYLIFSPKDPYVDEMKHVVVEAYNTGGNGMSNVMQDHIDEAIRYGQGEWRLEQYVANELNTYRIMPIIPRYAFYNPSTGEYGHSHGLDRDTMFIADNIDDIVSSDGYASLSREQLLELDNLDEQILNMINDAQRRLREEGFSIEEKVFMTGFSAAGSFSSRFTSFYPTKVQAMYSGGMHIPFVPATTYNGESLIYGVGAGDHLYLTGREFNLAEYNDVAKLMYLGGQDTNDPFPYNDVFSPDQRELAQRLYGTDYLSRWNNAQNLFFEVGGEGIFITSKSMQHTYNQELKDLVLNFFRSNIGTNSPVYFTSLDSSDLIMNAGDGTILTHEERDLVLGAQLSGTIIIAGDREPVETLASVFSSEFAGADTNQLSISLITDLELLETKLQFYLVHSSSSIPSNILDKLPDIDSMENGTFVSGVNEDGNRIIVIKAESIADLVELIENIPKDIIDTDY